MGHSYGSNILFNYAAIYPDEVEKMINIDCARFRNAVNVKKFVKKTKESVENYLVHMKNVHTKEVSGYNFEDCVQHMKKIRDSLDLSISEESCRLLCTRGAANMGNDKYYFTHDNRLKETTFGRNVPEYNLALASRIKCSVLNIHASEGINIGRYKVEEDKQIKAMQENAKSCVNLVLEGSHHLHLETPEVVATHVNEFCRS